MNKPWRNRNQLPLNIEFHLWQKTANGLRATQVHEANKRYIQHLYYEANALATSEHAVYAGL